MNIAWNLGNWSMPLNFEYKHELLFEICIDGFQNQIWTYDFDMRMVLSFVTRNDRNDRNDTNGSALNQLLNVELRKSNQLEICNNNNIMKLAASVVWLLVFNRFVHSLNRNWLGKLVFCSLFYCVIIMEISIENSFNECLLVPVNVVVHFFLLSFVQYIFRPMPKMKCIEPHFVANVSLW